MLVPRIFPYFIEICLIRNSAYFSAFYRKPVFCILFRILMGGGKLGGKGGGTNGFVLLANRPVKYVFYTEGRK